MKWGYSEHPNRRPLEREISLQYAQALIRAYDWEGLPEEIPAYMLEYFLFYRGAVCLFKFDEKFLALPLAKTGSQDDGGLDVYGRLTEGYPIAANGRPFPKQTFYGAGQNAVLIKANPYELPTETLVRPIISRMSYAWQSIGIAEAVSRVRGIVTAPDAQSKSVVQAEMNALTDGVTPFASYFDKSQMNGIGYIQAPVDSNDILNLWADFDNGKNLLAEWLGIGNNPSADKRERLITAEVSSNDAIVELFRGVGLSMRQEALAEAQRLWPEAFGGASVSWLAPEASESQESDNIEEVAKSAIIESEKGK